MVYYWVSWLAIISVAFFFSNNLKLQRFYLWLLLINVVFINTQIQLGEFTFTLPYLYVSIIFWIAMIIKKTPYFNYYLLFCLILSYLGLRFILITSPIWLFVNPFLMIAILFILILIFLVKNHEERVYILVLSCLTGEFIYAYHAKNLIWEVIIGKSELFTSLYAVILIMYFFNYLTTIPHPVTFK